jgi:hypothetical protein
MASDSDFLEFLKRNGLTTPKTIVDEKVDALKPFAGSFELLLAGVGKFEETLLTAFPDPKWKSRDFYSSWNRKTKLVELASRLGFAFPRTEVVHSADLTSAVRARSERPIVVKCEYGSGGRGVFVFNDAEPAFLRHLERATQGLDLRWLVQSWHEKAFDFYTVCEGAKILGRLKVQYDSQNNSWRHIGLAEEDSGVSRAASGIAAELAKEGYHGPFGMDGFVTKKGTGFPCIDLNVRLDKSRLLLEAAKKFSLPLAEIDAQRLRFSSGRRLSFAAWWQELGRELGLDSKGDASGGRYLRPLLLSSLTSPSVFQNERPIEILYFSGTRGQRPQENLSPWQEEVRGAILKVSK